MRVGLRVAMVAIVFASFVFVAPPALAGAMHTYCGADHTFLLGWGVVDLHHDGKAYDVAICMTVDQTFTNNYVSSRIRFDDNGDTALRNQNNVAERIGSTTSGYGEARTAETAPYSSPSATRPTIGPAGRRMEAAATTAITAGAMDRAPACALSRVMRWHSAATGARTSMVEASGARRTCLRRTSTTIPQGTTGTYRSSSIASDGAMEATRSGTPALFTGTCSTDRRNAHLPALVLRDASPGNWPCGSHAPGLVGGLTCESTGRGRAESTESCAHRSPVLEPAVQRVYPWMIGDGPHRQGETRMAVRTRQRKPTTSIVGANVYRHRVLRVPKVSQEEFAAMSDVSVETIRRLEQNRDVAKPQLSPHMDTLDKIAAALGVETSTLFDSDEQ